jgi:hypothetical protein
VEGAKNSEERNFKLEIIYGHSLRGQLRRLPDRLQSIEERIHKSLLAQYQGTYQRPAFRLRIQGSAKEESDWAASASVG